MLDLPRVGFWIGMLGGIFGIFGTIFAIWAFYQTKETKLINYERYSRTVFSDPYYFRARFHLEESGREDTTWLSESAIVIWNSGSTTIRDGDVRVPITLDMGKAGFIFDIKIVEVKSSVPNNFGISDFSNSEKTRRTATIKFKIFDPGMAIKIALVHQGGGGAISLGADLGPGVQIREFDGTSSKYFVFGLMGILGVFSVLVVSLVLNRITPRIRTGARKPFRAIVFTICFLYGIFVGSFVGKVDGWISTGPPISIYSPPG